MAGQYQMMVNAKQIQKYHITQLCTQPMRAATQCKIKRLVSKRIMMDLSPLETKISSHGIKKKSHHMTRGVRRAVEAGAAAPVLKS